MKTSLFSFIFGSCLAVIAALPMDSMAEATESERSLIKAAFDLDIDKVRELLQMELDLGAQFGEGASEAFTDPWNLTSPIGCESWTALIAVACSDRYPPPEDAPKNQDLEWAARERAKIPSLQIEIRNAVRLEIARMLIKGGVPLDAHDGYGATPLSKAIVNRFGGLATLFIQSGAKINTSKGVYVDGPGGLTPLHEAIGNPGVVAALLLHGADVNAATSDGDTPLHWAALKKDLASVVLLISAGSDRLAANKRGRKPVYWTSDTSDPVSGAIRNLLEKGPGSQEPFKPLNSSD